MWCTRWFLPLILLPLPTAPPFLLILFLFSLTMHARPCFYCIVLLTALFVSSCYWQPLPLDSPLSIPWSENITTFSDALNASIPLSASPSHKPAIIKLVDRCWCDLTFGELFEPFNVKRWEAKSLDRLRAEMERERESEGDGTDRSKKQEEGSESNAAVTGDNSSVSKGEGLKSKGALSTLQRVFWRRGSDPTTSNDLHNTSNFNLSSIPTRPGELNLLSSGFDLVLDFKWSRHPS